MPRLPLPWVAVSIILTVSPVDAQQVVEIDFTAGRTILDDAWQRAMDPYRMAVDWSRGVDGTFDRVEGEELAAYQLRYSLTQYVHMLNDRLREAALSDG